MPRITPDRIATRVSISISRTQGGNDQHHPYRVVLVDEKSGLQFAELRLSAEAFAESLTGSGSSHWNRAELISPEGYARMGLEAWNVSVKLGYDYDGQGWSRSDTRLRNLMEDSALHRDLGAETWSVTRHNDALSLTLRGYAPSPKEAAAAADRTRVALIDACERGAWLTKGLPHAHPTAQSIERDREYSNRRAD